MFEPYSFLSPSRTLRQPHWPRLRSYFPRWKSLPSQIDPGSRSKEHADSVSFHPENSLVGNSTGLDSIHEEAVTQVSTKQTFTLA